MPLLQWPDHGGHLCPNLWFKHSFCALVDLAYLFDSFHLRFLSQLLSQPFRFVLHKGFGGIAIPLDLLLLPKSRRWNLPKHSLFSLTGPHSGIRSRWTFSQSTPQNGFGLGVNNDLP